MILYGDLTKIEPLDDGSIRVHGVASTGARDAAGEVVTPDAMRAALPDYLAFGAIREMHQAKAAGAALSAEVGEDGATRIAAHIVDPLAVKKVQAGVYKGLSVGGKVLARDPADPTVITALRLDEISLVDRPCNPEAVIDLWKAAAAAGDTEAAARAPTNAEVLAEAEILAKRAGRPGRRNDYVAAARAALAAAAGEGKAPAPAVIPERGDAACPDPRAATAAVTAAEPHAGRSDSAHGPGSRVGSAPRDDGGGDAIRKLAAAEEALAAAHAEVDALTKRLAETDALRTQLAGQAAEIERLRSAPLPPRTAGAFARAVAKEEDGAAPPPLSPDAFAKALDALPPADRAHMLMKAALARPVSL